MAGMIDYSYDSEKNIVLTTRAGDIVADDLVDYIKQLDSIFSEGQSIYILEDIRNSNSLFDHTSDYDRITHEIELRACKYEIIKIAVVVDTPENTALSILYENAAQRIANYMYKTFSTTMAAEAWLLETGEA